MNRFVPGLSILPKLVRGPKGAEERLIIHNFLRQLRASLYSDDLPVDILVRGLREFDGYLQENGSPDLVAGLAQFLSVRGKDLRMPGRRTNQQHLQASSQIRLVASLRKRAARNKFYRLDDNGFAKILDPEFDESTPLKNRLLPWNLKHLKKYEASGKPALIRCEDPRFFWVTSTAMLERELTGTPTEIYNKVGKRGTGRLTVQVCVPEALTDEKTLVPTVFDTSGTDVLLFRPGSRQPDDWGRALHFGRTEDGLPEALHIACIGYRDCSYRLLGRTEVQPEAGQDYYKLVLQYSRKQASRLWRGRASGTRSGVN